MVDAKGDPMNGALSKIEKGLTKQPAFETIAAIAEALDVGLEWLAYGKGDAPAAGAPERAVAEYVRKRLREIDRKGLMLSDIADQLGVDRGMVRRAVGGIGIGDKSLPKWARALGFGSIEGLRGAALEWWRTTGEQLLLAVDRERSPDPELRAGVEMCDGYNVSAYEMLHVLEAKPTATTAAEWWKLFIAEHKREHDRDRAELIELERIAAQAAKQRAEVDAATEAAAEKLRRAREERGETSAPPPAPKSSPELPIKKRRAAN